MLGGARRRVVAAMLAGALLAGACSDDDSSNGSNGGDDPASVDTTGPPAPGGDGDGGTVLPGDGWQVDEPEAHGIDPAGLEAARAYAFGEGKHTQGVVVVHRGAIVAEWYADGADAESPAASWSMAKSFTSALVGIAIEQGLIPGIDEPMSTWFPDWAADDRAGITLGHVLQMSSGLDWNESYDPNDLASSDIINIVLNQPDQLAYAAGQPLRHEPGTVWSYASGDTMLLSGVLEQATGMSAAEYAEQVLFDPIDMEPAEWWQDAAGHTLTYCCIDTSSRAFARFGLLYLEGGRWGDEQVVPADWVAASTTAASTTPIYGYQWWLGGSLDGTGADGGFSAQGFDGQSIHVFPDRDLVVVRSGTYVKDPGPPVADPNLFDRYPSGGFTPGRGTRPPEEWNELDFLGPIVDAVPVAEP